MIEIVRVDLSEPRHARDLLHMMDTYASDPMGGGQALEAGARARLVDALRNEPHHHGLLAYRASEVVGLANCFRGFSTFRAAPLLNLHDMVVAPKSRGQGIGAALLAAVEDVARQLGCCKVTLEVLSGNLPAQAAYRRAGYAAYELDPKAGQALFWQKSL
jgi:GNAT superfamily N-acetyltransferase